MLYHLLYPPLTVIQSTTVRTTAAGVTAFLLSLLIGPWVIRTLQGFQFNKASQNTEPSTHGSKSATPTSSSWPLPSCRHSHGET